MERHTLRAALLAAGLPPESFQLEGVHTTVPLPTDFWFLRASGTGWEIGSYERGVYDVREVFGTEPAAADRLYEILTGRPAPNP